ncbi:hypothetical protein L596_015494 [Steinernema carpocapsae]|uniref:Uncharacterized protein n=1 Tax=Steinernema carpocapsae TaxID=34508 RepID=A0A4U5NF66_STECR|nr:hypothetical protein L596_015494 [Steinernema carpocapsae]
MNRSALPVEQSFNHATNPLYRANSLFYVGEKPPPVHLLRQPLNLEASLHQLLPPFSAKSQRKLSVFIVAVDLPRVNSIDFGLPSMSNSDIKQMDEIKLDLEQTEAKNGEVSADKEQIDIDHAIVLIAKEEEQRERPCAAVMTILLLFFLSTLGTAVFAYAQVRLLL